MTKREALIALLSLPDEPCLPPRRHGEPVPPEVRRDPELVKRDLGTAYVAWRRQEWTGGDISRVVSVRRGRKLKVVNGW